MKFQTNFIQGSAIKDYLTEVATMRINHFKDFPYLYQGSMQYEEEYLKGLANNKTAILITISVKDKIIAMITALPLVSDYDILEKAPANFAEFDCKKEDLYYIGEVIVEKQYRGQKLAKKLIKLVEEHAFNKGYQGICFLTVARAEQHPQRPENYQDFKLIASHLGYTETNLFTNFSWPTIQPDLTVLDQENPMVFWIKKLQKNSAF